MQTLNFTEQIENKTYKCKFEVNLNKEVLHDEFDLFFNYMLKEILTEDNYLVKISYEGSVKSVKAFNGEFEIQIVGKEKCHFVELYNRKYSESKKSYQSYYYDGKLACGIKFYTDGIQSKVCKSINFDNFNEDKSFLLKAINDNSAIINKTANCHIKRAQQIVNYVVDNCNSSLFHDGVADFFIFLSRAIRFWRNRFDKIIWNYETLSVLSKLSVYVNSDSLLKVLNLTQYKELYDQIVDSKKEGYIKEHNNKLADLFLCYLKYSQKQAYSNSNIIKVLNGVPDKVARYCLENWQNINIEVLDALSDEYKIKLIDIHPEFINQFSKIPEEIAKKYDKETLVRNAGIKL